MKKILLVVGHWNIENLTSEALRSWRNVDSLRRGTGASGERDYNWGHVAPRLKDKLKDAGFDVTIEDAIYHEETYNKSYDLCIILHFDGGGTENRSMICSPKRDQQYLTEEAHDLADKFVHLFRDIYPGKTGTINRDERITVGMLENYVFDYVNVDTPSVIIEEFNHKSAQGKKLLENPSSVVDGIYEVIREYFQLDVEDCEEKVIKLTKAYEELKKTTDKKISILNGTIKTYKEKEGKFNKEIQDLKDAIKIKDQKIKDLLVEINITVGDFLVILWNRIKSIKLSEILGKK